MWVLSRGGVWRNVDIEGRGGSRERDKYEAGVGSAKGGGGAWPRGLDLGGVQGRGIAWINGHAVWRKFKKVPRESVEDGGHGMSFCLAQGCRGRAGEASVTCSSAWADEREPTRRGTEGIYVRER